MRADLRATEKHLYHTLDATPVEAVKKPFEGMCASCATQRQEDASRELEPRGWYPADSGSFATWKGD